MKLKYKYTITLLACIFFLIPEAYSQTSSPYSRIGIGDIYYAYSARKLGMGQLGVADAESNFISFYNPAALYNLKRTRLEFNLNYHGRFLSDNNISAYYGKAVFGGFMFAFPASEKYGIGIVGGIIPYSNVSYDVVNSVQAAGEDYKTAYQGKGGLSRIFFGSSYKLPFDLSIGATFDYYFGDIEYISSLNFQNGNTEGAQFTNKYRPKGIGTTLGLISPDLAGVLNLSSITDFRFGLSYNYISDLKTDTALTSVTVLRTDTLASGIVDMKIPGRITAGLSFILNKKYLLSLDYAFQPWENYSFNNKTFSNLRNASKISAGFEFRPERVLGSSFWEQIIWRAGLSFEQTQYFVNNVGINQYSISGGLSAPISSANTLDLGIQYAMRGATDPGLFKENILKLYFTISLGDIWFIREEK